MQTKVQREKNKVSSLLTKSRSPFEKIYCQDVLHTQFFLFVLVFLSRMLLPSPCSANDSLKKQKTVAVIHGCAHWTLTSQVFFKHGSVQQFKSPDSTTPASASLVLNCWDGGERNLQALQSHKHIDIRDHLVKAEVQQKLPENLKHIQAPFVHYSSLQGRRVQAWTLTTITGMIQSRAKKKMCFWLKFRNDWTDCVMLRCKQL